MRKRTARYSPRDANVSENSDDEPPRKRQRRPSCRSTALKAEYGERAGGKSRKYSSDWIVDSATESDGSAVEDYGDEASVYTVDSSGKASCRKAYAGKQIRHLSHVSVYGPAYASSAFQGWQPPLPASAEPVAITDLKKAHEQLYKHNSDSPEYTYFILDDFSVYRPRAQSNFRDRTHEMVTLDKLLVNGTNELLFDGMLSCGDERHYVVGRPFDILTIDGYGDSEVTTTKDRICIQSFEGEAQNVWYQLGTPSTTYQRFSKPFAWLAQFTRYFVDYLIITKVVTLEHFRHLFHEWLLSQYGKDHHFCAWLAQAGLARTGLEDFRTTVVDNIDFLWKEIIGIDLYNDGNPMHTLWDEVAGRAIPTQSIVEKMTVVTPFAYDCFKGMYFAEALEPRSIKDRAVYQQVSQRKAELGLTPMGTSNDRNTGLQTPQSLPDTAKSPAIEVRIGDVVCVKPDTESGWKSTATVWYAYVQAVRPHAGREVLDVLWLYEPSDTTLGSAYYPFDNELFLSDNCSCGEDAIELGSILRKVEVAWFVKDPASTTGFFVRQKFRTVAEDDCYDFTTLSKSDFKCACGTHPGMFEECRRKYKVNDTVLVRRWSDDYREDVLEPAQVLAFDDRQQRIRLRGFTRKSTIDADAHPNELLLTAGEFYATPSKLVRSCHVLLLERVRVLRYGVPSPYDRGGTGDLFYIISDDSPNGAAKKSAPAAAASLGDQRPIENPAVETSTPLPNAGWDPNAHRHQAKLKGMGIFCGGGNFDRGLEDGGAVKFEYAIDIAPKALHTYRANESNPEEVRFWLGSVNDYLAQAIAGSLNAKIARPGDFQVLAAGSPCQGFSLMQINRLSAGSLKNASMLASVVSFVDFYSPSYCILENVVAMAGSSNAFSQVLAAFVALGYQVQQFLMDAWSFGSSQQRSRLFIVASAPGLAPFPIPQSTHAQPKCLRFCHRTLGKSSNGLPFGIRQDDCTPFRHLSASAAVADLPDIGDSQPQSCPGFPDHRTHMSTNKLERNRAAAVPLRPSGLSIMDAFRRKLLRGEPREYVELQLTKGNLRSHKGSKMFSRIEPESLFPTITTSPQVYDGKNGRFLHWEQQRPITIMEAKRAQGFLDHEVLIGSPADQMKVIGNSVDRKVALTLGLSLRLAWDSSRTHAVAVESERKEEHNPAGPPSPPTENAYRPATAAMPSRVRTVELTEAQKEDIRRHGFKAILRIFEGRESSGRSGSE